MFIVSNYFLAVFFCVVTMLCWGSWANTQKLVRKELRFELFYWDYTLGVLLISLVGAFTLGSFGDNGRSFLNDLYQADTVNLQSAFFGGVVFNLANLLLTAAIAAAGMAVAFPIGIGLALIIGVILNYLLENKGDPTFLLLGITLLASAIILNAIAYKKHIGREREKSSNKWVYISIIAGILMSTFYPFVAAGMDLKNFVDPTPGKMTPYTAFVVFAVGVVTSNIVFNTILMKYPLDGSVISFKEFFRVRLKFHLIGLMGGAIWGIGNLFNLVAAGAAGPAISYGLGQGATLVAALWGVFIWKEFEGSSALVARLIFVMFIVFIAGLGLIVYAGN